MRNKFYLTTPIYYVNDVPHIGHTYTTVTADILARWHRLLGSQVYFVTGSDEHGAKILEAASKKNMAPAEYCDTIVAEFKNAWQLMNISYDRFIRTTDQTHIATVEKFLELLHAKGDVYLADYQGNYCVQCEKFLTETELVDGCCPDHATKPVHHSEKNYFFKLGAYRERLLEAITDEKNPEHIEILPAERKNEIIGKLKLGLEDISISRASLPWAIPLPFDKSQTTYVWIDALLNYISAAGYSEPDFVFDGLKFQQLWPADLHLMAKDILWFHSVIWPAMLMAAGLPLPKKVFAHGFFTVKGRKMSKTVGNVLKPQELADKFGVDAARFLIINAFPLGADGDIDVDDFAEKYNAHLANNLGNLVSRVTNMADKYFNGEIKNPSNTDQPRREDIAATVSQVTAYMANVQVDKTLFEILGLSSRCNQYIDQEAPWKLAKTDTARLETVINTALLMIKYIALLVFPFMPQAASNIWESIGEKGNVADFRIDAHTLQLSGGSIKKPANLFPKIEQARK